MRAKEKQAEILIRERGRERSVCVCVKKRGRESERGREDHWAPRAYEDQQQQNETEREIEW